MYVRSLRLAGFKSFANATLLDFEPGVNVIVGPNGSGKSNIADALSWVLGSQAPSTLRGGAMEDVIFAGSQKRPRLGNAEVELTLDNSSGLLPLDLSEVTISRFTDRSGASEYRINGTTCRLLDVTELLSDTGIGRSLHALVGQGQLDQVLHARPEDRRTFVEEAAQVGKYRRRKERALKKIERVEDNLLRLNDVLSELRRAIRPLKRQATAAAAYSELVTELQELKQRLTATELGALAAEEASLDLEGAARRAEETAADLEATRAELAAAAEERQVLADDAGRARELAYRMESAAGRLQALGRLAHERADKHAARLAAETEEGYRERIRLHESERGRWERSLSELEAAAERARAGTAQAARRSAEAAAALAVQEERVAQLRRAETEAAQRLVRAEGSESAGRAQIGSIEARVQAVVDRKDVARHELAADSAELERTERESRDLELELDRVTEKAAAAEARLEEQREAADALKERLGATRADRAAAAARLAALRDAIAAVRDIPGAADRLAPLLATAEPAAAAAEASEDDAAARVARAEEEVERRWHEVAEWDEELRRLDALVSGAVERLAGTRRRREAREIELAALNEELARAREQLASAERAAVEERATLPAHRAELDQARAARERADAELAEARRHAEEARTELARAEVDARGAEERALAAKLRLEEAEAAVADARASLEGLAERRAALRRALHGARVVAEAAASAGSTGARWMRQARDRADQARSAAAVAESRLADLRLKERELEAVLSEAVDSRNRAEVRRAEIRARSAALAERAMDEWGLSADDLMTLERVELEQEVNVRTRVEDLERQMRRLGPVNPQAAEEYEQAEERRAFLEAQIEDLRSSKSDLMRVVRDVDATIVEVFGAAFEDVAREFQETFDRLFPGGAGTLKLTDASDLLTSGIEIEARPPGKNVKKLSLLSGGERSLVALAFLFAIFRARPSPFYLLDEVEAALDDLNLQRFLGLVRDLQEHAQVLLVTHQKRTMEAADVLYGVTMAGDGVSQVVARRMESERAGAAEH